MLKNPARRAAKSRNEPNKSNSPPNGALKLKPAAEYLGGLSKPTMYRLIQRGLLKPNRATRHLLFTYAELDRFLST
jgi:excisionase family DNA binding protein